MQPYDQVIKSSRLISPSLWAITSKRDGESTDPRWKSWWNELFDLHFFRQSCASHQRDGGDETCGRNDRQGSAITVSLPARCLKTDLKRSNLRRLEFFPAGDC